MRKPVQHAICDVIWFGQILQGGLRYSVEKRKQRLSIRFKNAIIIIEIYHLQGACLYGENSI